MNVARRNKAIEFFNQHLAVLASDKQLAYRLLCSTVTVDPTCGRGWYNLGCCLMDLNMKVAAVAAFRRCLSLPDGDQQGDTNPDIRGKAMVDVGHAMFDIGEIAEALRLSDDAVQFIEAQDVPDVHGLSYAWTNIGLCLSVMGDVAGSLSAHRKAHSLSKAAIVETGLAMALNHAGHYAEGLSHFGARFAYRKDLNHHLDWPYPVWDGTKTGTLLLASEQGAGDTLSFTRFVPAAAALADRVIYQVHPELLRLLTAGLQGWPNIEVVPQTLSFPTADTWCPVFSLPTALSLTSEQIRDQPQLWRMPHAWSSPVPRGWKSETARLHVGIAYAGSPLNMIDKWRSVPVTQFLDLYRVPGIQLYSLQVGERVADLHLSGAAGLIQDMSPYIKDASDTVAIMRELDLIVTIESFVGHLAGAMDKECWIPYSRRGGDWRIGRTGETPIWYPKHRVFRQWHDMEWPGVFDRIVEALRERVAGT